MLKHTFTLLGTAAGLAALSNAASACSKTTPCTLDDGDYYIAMPAPSDTPPPVIVYIHGYGGSPQGALENERMMGPFLERGYAVVAPQGLAFPGRTVTGWSFHPDYEKRRDEVSFIQDVLEDAVSRHELDPERTILTGFSIGGSMASTCLPGARSVFSLCALGRQLLARASRRLRGAGAAFAHPWVARWHCAS
ncbi:MAG: alpha/beta fold hydrolase [Pseudomonadota bacterium]